MVSDPLATWWVHSVTIEDFAGPGPEGHTFMPARTIACFVDSTRTLVRAPTGEQVVGGGELLLPGEVVLTGNPVAIGGELTASPIVRKLSFTGSTEVGRLLMAQSAPTIKKLSLELGGNAPFIVFDDADLDSAVDGAMASKYRNAGQTCVCANRIYAQAGIHDAFVEKLAAKVQAIKVGNGFEAGTFPTPTTTDKPPTNIAPTMYRYAKREIGGWHAAVFLAWLPIHTRRSCCRVGASCLTAKSFEAA